MIRINLLPHREQKRQARQRQFISLSIGLAILGLAVVLNGAQLVPGTSHTLTFGGKTATTIPAGAQVLSDPLTMKVQPLTELAVSVYLPDDLPASFRSPPAPYREAAFARGPGFCCVCGQPVYRFGWHVDLWERYFAPA